MTWIKKWFGGLVIAVIFGLGIAMVAYPAAVTQIAGLAVAQSSTKWNQLKDFAQGDGQSNGVGLVSPCLYNGLTCDRQRGSIAFGALVDVTRFPSAGTAFFAVDRADITTASVNLAFGFTSKKVMVRAAPSNTADVCLDWLGGTAVCPAANTAGDDRLRAGSSIIIDEYAVASLSVIAASGTQEIQVTAWN